MLTNNTMYQSQSSLSLPMQIPFQTKASDWVYTGLRLQVWSQLFSAYAMGYNVSSALSLYLNKDNRFFSVNFETEMKQMFLNSFLIYIG